MRRFLIPSLLSALLLMVAVGCEKPVIIQGEDPDEPVVEVEGTRRVRFSVSPLVQTAFDNAAEAKAREPRHAQKNLSEVCTRLSLAVFNQDGTKYGKVTNHSSDTDGFETFDVKLPEGQYRVLVVGYGGDTKMETSAASQVKIGSVLYDTFYCFEDITVDGSSESFALELHRCVAKVSLSFSEPLPEAVRQLKVIVKGGGKELNAETGLGVKASDQTLINDVTNWQSPLFEFFSIPLSSGETLLSIRVDALGANGETLLKKELSEVPVRKNYVTRVEGDFFGENPDDGRGKVIITIDDTWEGSIPYYF
ncbi:MAG: FimB/Mfa2 family fimbrial subunit [Prevotella sp.]|nr:FimB/Mfa2 family fimbrial subunit [Prevotella sp.]